MDSTRQLTTPASFFIDTIQDHHNLLNRIINSYESPVVRAYSKVRFRIININIMHILSLCLRGQRRVLDIGCGFGLFGCYFSALNPDMEYYGIDLNERRIQMANQTASRLGLKKTSFHVEDARSLRLDQTFDAILMIDLLHHIDDEAKQRLLETCVQHLAPNGRLIIKDVTSKPLLKIGFTWALDVLMTRGFDMWYWDEEKFRRVLGGYFSHITTYPISDLMPYPHTVYLSEKTGGQLARPNRSYLG